MAVLFTRTQMADDSLALYRASAESAAAGERVLSLLYLGGDRGGWPAPPDTLTVEESWRARGVYVFSPPFATADLTALKRAVAMPGQNFNRGLAWVDAPQAAQPRAWVICVTWTGADSGRVATTASLAFLNINLVVKQGVPTTLDLGDAPALRLEVGAPGTNVMYLGREKSVGPEPQQPGVALAFTPGAEGFGQIRFAADWRAQDFFQLFRDGFFDTTPAWGGEVRYFVQPPGATRTQQLVYPLFPAPGPLVRFALQVRLDPLAPDDGTATAFVLEPDVGALAALNSQFARSTTGGVLTLVPQPGVGFYLGRRPGPAAIGGANAYLATSGPFRIDLAGAAQARIMCGLTGQEFVTVADGDILDLAPGGAAFADLADPEKGLRALAQTGEAPILDSRFTTSWVRLRPALSRAETGVGPDYFAQSGNGTNFDRKALPDTTYSAATAARIGPAETVAFPMPFYGGIFPPDVGIEGWPNQGTAAADFEQAETGALASHRFDVIARAAGGAGPVLCTAAGVPLAGSRSATPNGALLDLGTGIASAEGQPVTPPGGWARLLLGLSDRGELYFGASATGSVDAPLAHALLNPQTFLVLNNWAAFPEFHSLVGVQGIDVSLSPPAGSAAPQETILVFKYADGAPLADLVERIDSWADPGHFIGGAPEVEAARTVLRQAIANARAQKDAPGRPFAYFLDTILTDPAWTGFLVFNAPVDGRQMPPDFQMILAGIDGELRAHHFGVETNRLDLTGGTPAITRSAFVGVFFHRNEEAPPLREGQDYGYVTTKLIIAIRNSAIQQFASQVAVTLSALFDRPVLGNKASGNDSPNTLRLDGDYQVIDGVGRVAFTAQPDRFFRFRLEAGTVRVLDQFALRGADLSPISVDQSAARKKDAAREEDIVKIAARLAIAGELSFVEDPFAPTPSAKPEKREPLDLFSYGVLVEGQLRGLPLSGLSLDLGFDLGPVGRVGDIRIAPNFANVIVADNADFRRPDGLVSGLPMRLVGLVSGDAGLAAIKRGGKVLNVPALMASGAADTGGSAAINAVPMLDATTPTPRFALAFELPLGSLGDLAETGVGLTCGLVLGWGPSAATPDNDGAALFVQLPALEGGLAGFSLQGFLQTTFGEANLARVAYSPPGGGDPQGVYVLLFNNVAISIFGIPLPPKVVTDFILFSNPDNPGGSDIAWSLAATQVTEKT